MDAPQTHPRKEPPLKTKFNLIKRSDIASPFYYVRFMIRGKSITRCLETTDASEAQRRAKLKYAAEFARIVNGEMDKLDSTKIRKPNTGTIAELIKAYKAGPADANAGTRASNSASLLKLIGKDGNITDLTAAAATTFFNAASAEAMAEPDQQKAAMMRRGANAAWRRSKSLFTPKSAEHLRAAGLYQPCIEEFVRAGQAARFTGRSVPKVEYNPPDDKIIAATVAAWKELALTDRDLYLAIGHELAFGLRISEVGQATWGWHQVRSGYPVLVGAAQVKSGSGRVQVRALDPYFTEMETQINLNGWRGEPDEHIIGGTKCYREQIIFRNISHWLRGLGWGTKKTNHGLRALVGGQVAMKYGIYEAQIFLRHSSVSVTETNYAHFIKQFRPENIDDLPARWAVIEKVATWNQVATLVATPRGNSTSQDITPTPDASVESRN